MKEKIKDLVYIVLIVSILGLVSFTKPSTIPSCNNAINPISNITYVPIYDTLTDWQIFVMALIEVECERNPKAKSNKNAIGPFQITPIYVAEINRIYNTDYKFEDAWDLNKSIKMFELMNDHYNPNRNIDKAIQIHNPGAGSWYAKRIKERMKLIKFSELVRSELTNLNS